MIAARYPYRDGIGLERCNACLRPWAACLCTRLWNDPVDPIDPTDERDVRAADPPPTRRRARTRHTDPR
jgi:hypothetical protein